MIRRDALDQLPVRTALPALRAALDGPGSAVLCAPPGTGKTTSVPLDLAGLTGAGPVRRVLVAEPRRMAARAAARRMAWLLGEEVGTGAAPAQGWGPVGFTVRGERRAGPRTTVEVVTTGVLLQRLQRDPELAGVDVVVLDECHERHLDADTSAAFLLDVRETLRPELRLVAASATTDAEGWARLLGGAQGAAPVVEAAGVSHPVEVVWAPPERPVRPAHGTRVDPALLTHVAGVVRRALRERTGDVLCFLPGVGEIGRVAGELAGVDAEVLQVHGRAPAEVQDAVLAGGNGVRRVVLATSVAESSLTVPGVRVVVDSGLARVPRTDHARGLSALTTVRASRAAARQRAGRAGREAPGAVYRCWSEGEDGRLPAFPDPEIKVADLTAFALQAACWGDPAADGLALLDAPPAGALAAAREVLTAIGAVDGAGRATERGVRMARLGLHPRLARALLDGAPEAGVRRAAEVVALLSEEPPRAYGDDLAAAWRTARRGGDAYGARWRQEARRLASAAGEPRGGSGAGGDGGRSAGAPLTDDAVAGLVAALAFPERVARARRKGSYLMASGTGAELAGAQAGGGHRPGASGPGDGSGLRDAEWLAVAVADRPVAAASARVRLAAVIDEETACAAAPALYASGEEVGWSEGDVVARRVTRLGAIELAARPLTAPDPGLLREAVVSGLRREGLGLLRWPTAAVSLRQRMAFVHRELGAPWPDVSDAALLECVEEWLGVELGRARRRADLERVDAGQALARLLPWATGEAARFDELAPERIEVPSGSRVRVDYGGAQPVLAVKLQELFGWQESPRVAGGRVPVLVHLLSPAGRPAAVTADLASFWRDGYRAVRAELRGRYPKHPWPEDPSAAEPTRHTSARLKRG
ncbi:ATP-dependent helicase HrpB [Streptomyces sp. Je 1-4]|uniref:ATP-dependent helicase HrpB n=1 Tax=Streptomyces TaxID=1883 RepID=UPI00140EB2AE|nr:MULTISPECIES: ATP-dependent helicase HrpB [unclassified Streptomyces]QIK09319.1 ATP-dependent helicase HrpB [Streptomyces sp. ID38640]UYB43016.1 ATP-dependent helicase HrpB [Streptomyces sp. Je 1-4]UZQ39366.1 ATP-dependent helicase HrpB [Streptomyces sp. Je 1-4] [Streptomyces sp. Je 1-4 4N24]UZQ46783.1 ATP-dependent helicase HrpB [Streptomyces sp. Je 1-4] [Streptomyces sp. Je 1-4 4N24_ara]